MKKRRIIKVTVFLALCLAIAIAASNVVVMPFIYMSDRIRADAIYDKHVDDTWSGAIMGTSSVYCGWVAPYAWEEYGLTIYPSSFNGIPFFLYENLIRELRKRHDMDFFVIDVRGVRKMDDSINEAIIRYVTDVMPMSANKLDALNRAFEIIETYNDEKMTLDDKAAYYFPLLKYHSRWSMLEEADYVDLTDEYKGAPPNRAQNLEFRAQPVQIDMDSLTEECESLDPLQEKYLYKLLDYAKEENLRLLFVSFPATNNKNVQKAFNEAFRIVESYGYDTLNFNTAEMYEEVGWDFNADFRNGHHLNSKGAMKLTGYLGNYIREHYELPDHRGEEAYRSWDEAWVNYEEMYRTGWEKAGG